ncbi:cytochrome P450 4V2-like [Diadema antillarum]|uniref:cytochrome P450 4V2-like n=1 Tax=Diadema antillarum TaxID=105358 RepID=UPI003A83CDE2
MDEIRISFLLTDDSAMAGETGIGTLAAIFVVTSIIVYYAARFIRIYLLISKFQGPPALPIIGNTYQFSKDPREFFLFMKETLAEYREETGGIIRWWFGPKPSLTIYSAKYMKVILTSTRQIKKGFTYPFLESWLGLGLLLSTGGKWFHRRKMLTPAFHFSILQNFMDVYNEQSNILAEKLDAFADKRDPVNIFPLVTYCTLDVICDSSMGKHVNAQGNSDNDYVRAVRGMGYLFMERFKSPLMWPDIFYFWTAAGAKMKKYIEILHGVTKEMIKQKLKESLERPKDSVFDDGIVGKRKRVAFLDLLIQMHREDPSFTLADIQEEVDTFMFAGHDTTAVAISWCIQLIGLHQDVQVRLHEEIDEVLGDANRPVNTDDLTKFSYLDRVLKETLRLFPPAPAISRTLDEDIVIDGKVVPKETDITLRIYDLHRDPEQFPDPERFDPDRFLPENSGKRHPYAYVPFSAGPRNCIGQKFAMMEARVTLANLLRRFSFQPTQTIEETKPAGAMILKPTDEKLLIKITKRK